MSKTLCAFCKIELGESRLVVHSADPKVPTSGVFCLPKVGAVEGCYTKALEAAR